MSTGAGRLPGRQQHADRRLGDVTATGLAERDGKRISFNEFTAFGARVTGIMLSISTLYLALRVYAGSTPVNLAGAAILVAMAAWFTLRPRAA